MSSTLSVLILTTWVLCIGYNESPGECSTAQVQGLRSICLPRSCDEQAQQPAEHGDSCQYDPASFDSSLTSVDGYTTSVIIVFPYLSLFFIVAGALVCIVSLALAETT